MKQKFFWSFIMITSLLMFASCDCDDVVVNTPLQVQYKTMAQCADEGAYASLAVFMQQPSATWQIQDYAVTKYTIWYETTTPDNSWVKIVVPGNYFTQVHYQNGFDSTEYGPFRSITVKTVPGFLQNWFADQGLVWDQTKVRQIQIEFMFKVHDVWYKTSIDTYPVGYVDTFWV